MKKINVAFAFDYNYYRQAIVAISSLLDCSKNISYNIYCFIQNDISLKTQKEIRKEISKKSSQSNIFFIKMPKYFSDAYECRGITKSAYFRLMLHRLLPNLDKIIYSDVDVIFKTDLSEIDNINMDSYFIGAAKDALYNTIERREWAIKNFSYWNTDLKNIGNNYKNSGFLILNLQKLREANFDDKIIELSKRNYNFQDQDIINILFVDTPEKVYIINSKYIVLPGRDYKKTLEEGIISTEMYNDILYNPAILHYAGKKPWDDNTLPLANEWWDYVASNTKYYKYFKKRLKLNNTKYKYRLHIGPFDIFSKQKKGEKRIYKILGIKITKKKKYKQLLKQIKNYLK